MIYKKVLVVTINYDERKGECRMSKLLAGLSKFGLGDLENKDIFEKEKKENTKEKLEPVVVNESDFIYDRSYECPVCGTQIVSKTVKTGKAKLNDTDIDLRPKYDGIDVAKYDVVLCEKCGFAALSRYFKNVTSNQRKLIKENISKQIQLTPHVGDTYSYEEALERYQLALACSVVKRSKASEKAYTCLKAGWLLRGQAESIEESNPEDPLIKELSKAELAYLKNAYEGFVEAKASEQPPICGMDDTTVDILIAALAIRVKDYKSAGQLVSNILTSTTANNRIKDKARELKEIIMVELKKK